MQYRFELVRPSENMQADTHYNYIAREGKYAKAGRKDEDLVYKTYGNLPSWAETPVAFWEKATEICNGTTKRAYLELRLSLQEELSLQDNVAIIEDFLTRTGIKENHVYSYAIHDKVAAFDKEHRNIHCHLIINEKIIEKNRPLKPEQFFKRYSKNKDGELTGGYKGTRIFQREELRHLREIWQNVINEKFAEKNINMSVDCRTLAAQKEELLSQGKIEDAKLLDRQPGSHLGPAFLNPAIRLKILNIIDYMKKNKDYEILIKPSDNASFIDKKIYEFAKDFQIRMMAKNIVKERQEALLKIQRENELKEISFKLDEPFVITVNNLKDAFRSRLIDHTTQLNNLTLQYQETNKKIMPSERIPFAAKNLFCNGEYKKALQRYKQLSDALTTKKDIINQELLSKSTDYDKIADLRKETNNIQKEKNIVGSKLALMKQKIENNKTAVQDIEQRLMQQNADNIPKRNNLYIQLKFIERKTNECNTKLRELDIFFPDKEGKKIIFANKIPPAVILDAKLNGEIPLRECKFKIIEQKTDNDGTYIILLNQNANQNAVEAIKLYGEMIKGKTKVYIIDTSCNRVIPTNKTVPLYKIHKDINKTISSEKHLNLPTNTIKNILNNLMDKALVTKTPNIEINWNNSEIEGKIDDAKIVDKQLSL